MWRRSCEKQPGSGWRSTASQTWARGNRHQGASSWVANINPQHKNIRDKDWTTSPDVAGYLLLVLSCSLTSSGCFFAVGFSWSPTRHSLGPRDRSEWTSTWNWTTTPPSTRRPTHLSSWVAPEVFEARIFWSSHHNYHQGISVRALVHVTASTDYGSLNLMMIWFLSQT